MPKIPLPIVDQSPEESPEDGYRYFMQSEPREHLGPIRLEHDEVFGRKVKVRDARIGTVRNAKSENRKTVKVFLEPYPHIRVSDAKPLQGWYKSAEEKSNVRPRSCYTEALLTQPYGGCCQVNCTACYINSGIRGYKGSGLVTVPLNYGEQIRVQLSKIRRGSAGYLTSFNDPFNSLEAVYHNTEEAAKEFVKVGLPIFFLSRLWYPDWALDLLKHNKYSYAQKSVNTSNPETWKKLSPGALPLEDQFKDIRRIASEGIYVSVQVSPIIPGVVDHDDVLALFKRLGEAGAKHVIVKFAEAAYSWAPTMVQRMVDKFGQRGEEFAKLFTQNIGGEKTVVEDYRIRAHKLYRTYAKRYGLTYAVCHEYAYTRDSEGSVVSKTGESLGPSVTTSDQCHGKRVPVFTRDSADEPFREVKECPPSGCLYCASNNGGKPLCGDALAGKALALRMEHLRQPIKRS